MPTMNRWCAAVESILSTVIVDFNISSGALVRGSEIEKLGIRNSASERPGIFYIGTKILIVLSYNKTSAIKRGRMEFVPSYLDKNTSFLFKAFFLLTLYVLNGFEKYKKAENSSFGTEYESRSMLKVRYNILMGQLETGKVTEIIGF